MSDSSNNIQLNWKKTFPQGSLVMQMCRWFPLSHHDSKWQIQCLLQMKAEPQILSPMTFTNSRLNPTLNGDNNLQQQLFECFKIVNII